MIPPVLYWLWIAESGITHSLTPMIGWLFVSLLILILTFLSTPPEPLANKHINEQKLFLLTPLLPSPRQINHHVARHLVLAGLAKWLKMTVFFTLVSLVLLTPAMLLLIQLSISSMALPLVALVLGDYSRPRASPYFATRILILLVWGCFMLIPLPANDQGVLHFLWSNENNQMVLTLFKNKLLWFYVRPSDLIWHGSYIASNMLLAFCLITIRWRAMVRATAAFPVGRFPAS